MNKKFSLLLIFALLVMSFTVVGCTNDDNAGEQNQDAAQEENKEGTTDVKDVEKQKLSIIAKTLIAEEKLTFIFENYTPEGSEQEYLVAKPTYKSLDDVKNYLSAYYTEGMTNTLLENYIKMEDVAGKGQVPTLTLPEDYVAFTSAIEPEITVDGDNAQLQFTQDGKTVTYTYVNVEGKWLIDTKTVQ